METTKGKILLASPRLADPNFFHAVVLMVQHSEEGALGLVLNRPLTTTVREACEESVGEDCKVDDFLHQGGPCEGPLMVLHRSEIASDSDVLPGIFFSTERDNVETLLRQPQVQARYFVGYAGWSPGQLEAEMEVESWITMSASEYHIFDSDENLWSKLMTQRMLGNEIDPREIPDDPSVN